ncbi:MAG: hypothetical protein MZV65_41555 [Chromatiales bacterium]|nr:hypothetical protein [Chromatiales bacterium]
MRLKAKSVFGLMKRMVDFLPEQAPEMFRDSGCLAHVHHQPLAESGQGGFDLRDAAFVIPPFREGKMSRF